MFNRIKQKYSHDRDNTWSRHTIFRRKFPLTYSVNISLRISFPFFPISGENKIRGEKRAFEWPVRSSCSGTNHLARIVTEFRLYFLEAFLIEHKFTQCHIENLWRTKFELEFLSGTIFINSCYLYLIIDYFVINCRSQAKNDFLFKKSWDFDEKWKTDKCIFHAAINMHNFRDSFLWNIEKRSHLFFMFFSERFEALCDRKLFRWYTCFEYPSCYVMFPLITGLLRWVKAVRCHKMVIFRMRGLRSEKKWGNGKTAGGKGKKTGSRRKIKSGRVPLRWKLIRYPLRPPPQWWSHHPYDDLDVLVPLTIYSRCFDFVLSTEIRLILLAPTSNRINFFKQYLYQPITNFLTILLNVKIFPDDFIGCVFFMVCKIFKKTFVLLTISKECHKNSWNRSKNVKKIFVNDLVVKNKNCWVKISRHSIKD